MGLETHWYPRMDCEEVQAMYWHGKSKVWINNSFSKDFDVKVGIHQGSVLSPFLFVIVLDTLSRDFSTGAPWELLYAENLVLATECLDELPDKFLLWKHGLESRGLKVNMKKTKVMISGLNPNTLRDALKINILLASAQTVPRPIVRKHDNLVPIGTHELDMVDSFC